MPDYAVIVAESLDQAHNSADIDWGWHRTAKRGRWETAAGETVIYAGDHHQAVFGLPWGTRLYQGYGWFRRRDAHEIKRLIEIGRLIVVPPSEITAPSSASRR